MSAEPGDPSAPSLPPDGTSGGKTGGRVRQLVVVAIALVLLGGGAAYLLSQPDGAEPDTDPEQSPGRASPVGFCEQYAELVNLDDGQSVHEWAEAMADVGTPKDLSPDGRAGFVVVLKRAERVDEDATVDDLVRRDANLGDSEARNVEAFAEYATTTCTRELESALREAAAAELAS